MVRLFVFAFLFIDVFNAVSAQSSDSLIQKPWIDLRKALQKRCDYIPFVLQKVSQSNEVDKDLIDNAKKQSDSLSIFLTEVKNIDSLIIQSTFKRNQKVTLALAKVVICLERDSKFRNTPDIRGILIHLEGLENRIYVFRNEFNNACFTIGKPDLLYPLDSWESLK